MLVASAIALAGACSSPAPSPGASGGGGGASGGGGGAGGGGGGGDGGAAVCVAGEEQRCYPGPDGTEGVGACTAGVQRCLPDGSGFGACEGAVTPVDEDCSTGMDDDCDGVTNEPDAGCACIPGQIEPCYSGPDGTLGRGLCRAGLRTCEPSGTAWRACNGEVTPALETCDDDIDEDCDGFACSAPLWGALFGDANIQSVTGVGVDARGNIYVGGTFSGTIYLGGEVLASIGTSDVFVASFDASGAHRWSARFGGSGAETLSGLAVAPSGGVALGGTFYGSFPLGDTTLTSVSALDSFVARLDEGGSPRWARAFGDRADQTLRAIAVDPADNVIVVGYFNGALVCSAPPVPTCITSAGGTDIFVRKYDPLGDAVWTKVYGDAVNQFANAVAADADGNVLITGRYNGTLTMPPRAVTNGGVGPNIFVAKLDPGGDTIWLMDYGDSASQSGTGIAADASGAVLLTGTYTGTADFGPAGTLPLRSAQAAFVASLAPDGQPVWVRWFQGDGAQETAAVAVDAERNVVVTGSVQGSIDLGGGPLPGGAAFNAFLVKLDPQGSYRWGKVLGAAGNQRSHAVATAPATGAVVIGGTADGVINFGLGDLRAAGTDAFASMFAP